MRTRIDDSSGLQTTDIIYRGRKLRIVVPFDFYDSYYGSLWRKNGNTIWIPEKINGEHVDTLQKFLFRLPWKIRYSWNHGKKVAFKARPEVWILVKAPKFVKIQVSLIKDILRYCEANSIYDKLGAYGDFYYKLKKRIKE